jgi:hypothetical protein
MSTIRSTTTRAALCLSALTAPLAAQRLPTAAAPQGQRICDMSYRMLIMSLVDSSGVPVPDATVTVRRVRSAKPLPPATAENSAGTYVILGDEAVRAVASRGEPIDVTFTKGSRTKRVRVRIGADPAQCHVQFMREPKPVVF